MVASIFSRQWVLCATASALLALCASWAVALELTITGDIDEELTEAIQGGSLLSELADAEEPPDARDIVVAAQADYRRIIAILYDNGYFGPEISIKLDRKEAADIVPVTPPSNVNSAVIDVRKGKQFKFGRAEIEPVHRKTNLPEAYRTGEIAKISAAQAATRAVINGWRNAGHAKAELGTQEIIARHRESRLDVDITVTPGPRLRFGALGIEGESAVRRERILEIAALPEGEVYSPGEIEDAAERLRRTGAFRAVALIEGDVAADGETLPIQLRVSDNKPRRFGFGGELATIEGLTLTGYWLHRNILGGAERLRIEGEVSGIGGTTGGINYLLRTRFDRPSTFNEDTNFYGLAEIEQEDEPNYFSRQTSIEAGIERFATDRRTYRLGLGFRRAVTEDALGDSDYTILSVPLGLTFDYRNDEFDALRGYYADATVAPFHALAGTDDGVYTELDLRGYQSFGEVRPTTLALRLQIGSLAGPALENAPADLLFYSGGGDTVRGQDYQSLGIQVGPDEDDLIGGRSFLGVSAEVRMRTEGALGFVAFADAGYIGREAFPDGSSGEWHSGAGLGVRYATPIGPIRFDVAVPTSGKSGDNDFQLYFGIGQSF